MKELLGLELRNTGLFERATLNFNTGNLVCVTGNNLNTRTTNGKTNTNAVGKSLLFSMIPNITQERTALAAKAKSKKNVFGESNGYARLYSANMGRECCFEQGSDGKYRIFENGNPYKNATIKNSRDIMQSLLPLSEDFLHQMVYLSSTNHDTFTFGKPEQRREFFSTLFNYTLYDELLVVARSRLAATKKQLTTVDGLNASLASSTSRLNTLAQIDVTKLDDLEAELEELEAFVDGKPSVVELRRKQERVKTLNEKLNALPSEAAEKKALRLLAATAAERDTLRDAVKNSERVATQREQFDAQLEKLQRHLPDLTADTLPDWADDAADADATLHKLFPKYAKQPDDVRQALKDAAMECLFPQAEPVDEQAMMHAEDAASDAKVHADDIRARIRMLEKHAGGSDSHVCPLCQSELDVSFADELADLETQLEPARMKAEARVRDVLELEKQHQSYLNVVALAKQLGMEIDTYQRNRKKMVRLYEDAKLAQHADALDALDGLATQLGTLTTGDANAAKRLAELEADRAQAERTVAACAKAADMEDELDALEAELKDVDADELMERIMRLTEVRFQHIELSRDKARYDELVDMIGSLRNQRDQFVELEADVERLEHLVAAYSTTGVRLDLMRGILSLLTTELNEFSYLLFAEKYEFEAVVTDTKFEILAARNNGKPGDIFYLSKSERQQFLLLFMYCLNRRMPSADRFNMVALDEMEHGMGDMNMSLYRDQFLPHLHELIPNVFVISPHVSLQHIDGAKHLVVVKDGSVSRLEADDPELLTLPVDYLIP